MSLKDEIKELEDKIEELKKFSKEKNIDFSEQIGELEKGLENKYRDFTENEMDSWERIQISRNSKRPYTLDYIEILTQDFVELHGDRLSKDDHAIVGGLASVDGYKILIIGHQKGRDLDSNMFRNFGMASPEGYRKALRLMRLAERFELPILTLIDTAGAYPGIEAEEKGQGEAIAKNLAEMFGLKVPIVSVIIGEGGSGGALGIGVADSVLMLENRKGEFFGMGRNNQRFDLLNFDFSNLTNFPNTIIFQNKFQNQYHHLTHLFHTIFFSYFHHSVFRNFSLTKMLHLYPLYHKPFQNILSLFQYFQCLLNTFCLFPDSLEYYILQLPYKYFVLLCNFPYFFHK